MEERCSKTFPKEILSMEFKPEGKLAHFIIEMKKIPNPIRECSDAMEEEGVQILSGFHMISPKEELHFWSLFIDFTNAKIKPPELAEKLKKLDAVEHVKFMESFKGLLIDMFHFPLRWGGERAMVMRTEVMASMMAKMLETYGTGGATILFQIGSTLGQNIEGFKKQVG